MRVAPRSPRARRGRAATVAAATVIATSCGGADDETVTVFVASSLGDVVAELGAASGLDVRLNVAGSAALRLQLDEGAAADVFIPADPAQLDLLTVDVDGEQVAVATNTLVVAHRADGPAITLDDFDTDDLLLGACAPAVPCGGYAALAFDAAGITPRLDTEEPDVRSVAAKVADGELDAGIVYLTDVLAEERLAATPIDDGPTVAYEAAVLADAPNPAIASALLDFLTTDAAARILADHGFGAP